MESGRELLRPGALKDDMKEEKKLDAVLMVSAFGGGFSDPVAYTQRKTEA